MEASGNRMTRFFQLLIGTIIGCIIGLFILVFIFTAVNVSTFRHDCASINGVAVKTNPGWICISNSVVLEVK